MIGAVQSRTKNVQDAATLARILAASLPGAELGEAVELSEGYFNVAYLLRARDGREVVVKVAPAAGTPVMSSETGIMAAEVAAMELVATHAPEVPAPRVLRFDDTGAVCDAPYVVMTVLPGASLSSLGDGLDPASRDRVWHEVGRLTRLVNQVQGPAFGYLAQPGMHGHDWAEVFTTMLGWTLDDAARMQVELPVPPERVRTLLSRDRRVFEEVRTPQLVHWDLWAGNVFVADGQVTGLIDWERSLWGDPLLEVGFRTYAESEVFLAGYGRAGLSPTERLRALWYDVYLLLIAAQEGAFRHYADDGIRQWAADLLPGRLAEIEGAGGVS